jgi:hypothetical protein
MRSALPGKYGLPIYHCPVKISCRARQSPVWPQEASSNPAAAIKPHTAINISTTGWVVTLNDTHTERKYLKGFSAYGAFR